MNNQIKTAGFSESSIVDLSHNINIFFEEKSSLIDVIDIKYNTIALNNKDRRHYALIIFRNMENAGGK